jgi:catechol 2,3-dioxygenase-like lactoylglutathione lyase family enzyme
MTNASYALRLDRVGLNVADLGAAIVFYTGALGFEVIQSITADPALALLLGARTVRRAMLMRGRQRLELMQCDPPGRPMQTAAAATALVQSARGRHSCGYGSVRGRVTENAERR